MVIVSMFGYVSNGGCGCGCGYGEEGCIYAPLTTVGPNATGNATSTSRPAR